MFTLTVNGFYVTVANILKLTALTVTITPGQPTVAVVNMASLIILPLNNLMGTVNGLTITQTGFSIANATISASTVTLGGILNVTSPMQTLTNINYVDAGMGHSSSLTGVIGLSTASATLALGSALQTSAGNLTGTYDLGTGILNVSVAPFALSISGFVSINAASADVNCKPSTASNASSTILVGIQGATVFLGSGSVGVQVSNGSLALAIFDNSGTNTYAFQAIGSVARSACPPTR